MSAKNANVQVPDQEMLSSLKSLGMLNDETSSKFEALTGGVSSDIWKVSEEGREYCVKRALSKLKVAADWFAPVERNKYEVYWYQMANEFVPGAAPRILAHDENAMLCAMEFLEPSSHTLWKEELRDGRAEVKHAARLGQVLGQIHAKSAGNPKVADLFPENDIFHAIRLEPYLEATADKHPDLKGVLFGLSQRTGETKLVMIHGDVSPKNILIGPNGPVILDAECACIGDPSFDLAFCLNHFLLKCLWTPTAQSDFLACFRAMTESYLSEVTWEERDELEARTATLLPGLFLARVDGKSPAEYIIEEKDKDKVRSCARALLFNPSKRLSDVADTWSKELNK